MKRRVINWNANIHYREEFQQCNRTTQQAGLDHVVLLFFESLKSILNVLRFLRPWFIK